jgi:hypothetical protein
MLLQFDLPVTLVSGVCTTLRSAHKSRVSLDRFNIRQAEMTDAYCPGSARGEHFSKALQEYTQQNLLSKF